MKVVIFENEYEEVKQSFSLLDILYYNHSLSISVFSKSQDAGPIEDVIKADFVFVDLELAPKSDMDGYQVIKQLIAKGYPMLKIAVLTGNRDYQKKLSSQGISNDISVVTKPVTYKSLHTALSKK